MFTNLFRRKKSVTPKARPRFQPTLESLEERITPTAYVWDGASPIGPSVANSGNWNPSGDPGVNDTVRFTTIAPGKLAPVIDFIWTVGGVTIDSGFAGHGISVGTQIAGTNWYIAGGDSNVFAAGTIQFNGGIRGSRKRW